MTGQENPPRITPSLLVVVIAVLFAVIAFIAGSSGGQIQSTTLNESEAAFIENCNQNGGAAMTNFDKEPAQVEFCEYENGTRVNYTHD